tara:strand:- start:44690 stop:46108 length:1419 start_codon:yes stop_codon:yes gene_type:complete
MNHKKFILFNNILLSLVCFFIVHLFFSQTALDYRDYSDSKWTVNTESSPLRSTQISSEINYHLYHGLNLSQNSEFKEYQYKSNDLINTIQFDTYLEEGAFLYFIFEENEEGHKKGIRLSRNTNFKSFLFEMTKEGKFLKKVQLKLDPIALESSLQIQLIKKESSFKLFINDIEIKTNQSIQINNINHISIKGNDYGAYVKNLEINKDLYFKDRRIQIYLFTFTVLTLLIYLFHYFNITKVFVSIQLFLLFFGTSYLLKEKLLFSNQTIPKQDIFSLKVNRDKYFERANSTNLRTNNKDIFFFGGSSMYGVGATSIKESFSFFLNNLLDGRILNYAFPGATLSYHLKVLKSPVFELQKIKEPSTFVILFGYNDLGHQTPKSELVDQLNELINLLVDHKLIIIKEQLIDFDNNDIYQKFFDDLESEIPDLKFHNINSKIIKHNNEGDMWYDNVHLTSFGQAKAGLIIAEILRGL